MNRILLLCLAAFAGTAAALFASTPQFVQHACAVANFILLYVTLQTVHGRGLCNSPAAYDAMPSHAVGLWLTAHTFATLLAVRGAAQTLQASPHKGHPGEVMSLLYATLELLFLMYVYGQRTGALSDFDPRDYRADKVGTASELLRSASEVAQEERMEAEQVAMSGNGGHGPAQTQRSSEYGESLWQLLSFSWLNPLIAAGAENALVLSECFWVVN